MQTVENNNIYCAEITMLSFTNVQSHSVIGSVTEFARNIYPVLTCIQPQRSLIAGEFFTSFSRTALSHRAQDTLASEKGNITVHITRSYSPDINPVDYTICGIA